VTCAPQEEIDANVLGANFNIIIEELRTHPNGTVMRNLLAPHWRLFPNVTLAVDIFLTKHTLNRITRIIGSDAGGSSNQTLRYDTNEEFSRPTLPAEGVFAEVRKAKNTKRKNI
jgi:hypothetical protein